MDTLSEGLIWSRCCDIVARIYRLISDWSDRTFADRVLVNVLCIPEHVAARMATTDTLSRAEHTRASVEALTILQTQLYLAGECGLLERNESAGLCFEAAVLVERLVRQQQNAALEDRDAP